MRAAASTASLAGAASCGMANEGTPAATKRGVAAATCVAGSCQTSGRSSRRGGFWLLGAWFGSRTSPSVVLFCPRRAPFSTGPTSQLSRKRGATDALTLACSWRHHARKRLSRRRRAEPSPPAARAPSVGARKRFCNGECRCRCRCRCRNHVYALAVGIAYGAAGLGVRASASHLETCGVSRWLGCTVY